jgi:hypothetical protein
MIGGARADWIESLRQWIVPKFGVVAKFFNEATDSKLYVTSSTNNRELVGRVGEPIEEFELFLEDAGFERNPLASLKRWRSKKEWEDGSWRKVGYEDSPHKQLHIVVYDSTDVPNADPGSTFVYAHWETRWDTKPWSHYHGHDYDPEKGVKMTRDLLNRNGYSWNSTRPSAYATE